jgi:hypothetical protein
VTVTPDEFIGDFTPEEWSKLEARTTELIEEELTLRDLRRAERLTRERLAELMGVEQEMSRGSNVARTCCSRRLAATSPRWAASCD